jgi:hypothetical protein
MGYRGLLELYLFYGVLWPVFLDFSLLEQSVGKSRVMTVAEQGAPCARDIDRLIVLKNLEV